MSEKPSVFAELKRRNVIRAAILYVGATRVLTVFIGFGCLTAIAAEPRPTPSPSPAAGESPAATMAQSVTDLSAQRAAIEWPFNDSTRRVNSTQSKGKIDPSSDESPPPSSPKK